MSRITVAEQMRGVQYDKGKRIASNTFRCSQDRKEVTAREKLAKRIKSYCDGLKIWLEKNPSPMPDEGDCWYCYFKACKIAEELQAGSSITARDKNFFGGAEHLEAHLKEKYYHGSLIYCALAWKRYHDPGLIIAMDIKDSMLRAVRDYLKANLGL